MSEQLKSSIVRIFLQGRDVAVGVGFLVPDRHVLTCAHVVIQALSLKDTSYIPAINLSLDFPFVAPGNLFNAQVVCWQPKTSEDIAVLELESLPPDATRPIRLVTAQDLWGHSFRAFGFPRDYDGGVWASGVMRDRHAGGWIQIEAVNVPGHSVVQGFSGTPVWDEQLDGVAGMVVESDTQASVKAAYIIPTALLIKAWSSLGQQAIPPCPYRGLFAFREIDAPYFFGRETYTSQLVEVVRKRRLVTVIGPSGSGKSSVVFAGLVPRLRQEENWLITSFRPGDQPFRSLATALIPLLEVQMSETDRLIEIKKLAERFQQGGLALRDVVERIVQKHFGAHLLLIADQFEELYTLNPSTEEQQYFLDFLLATGLPMFQQRTSNFNLIITLRADFFGHALSYRPFADALQHTDVKLGPMTRQELQDAIKKPAEKLQLQIEDGLIERILGTVSREPGYLPLLEFALTLMWSRQREGILPLVAYDEIGGVERSLAVYAEEFYSRLSEEEQKRTQQIFIQLVHPGVGTEDTRRLATQFEVGEVCWSLVPLLSDARLVVSGRDESTGYETVEVVHEALIKGWKRLGRWVEENREFRTWQERLRAALYLWVNTGKDNGALLRGVLLVEAMTWLEKNREAISLPEQAFIEASQQHENQELRRWKELYEEAEQQRQAIERLEHMREDFYTRIAHELKTPLANIRAHLSALQIRDHNWSIEEQLEFLRATDEQTERLVGMINHFLDASRVEAGALRVELEPVLLPEFFEDLQERLEALITSSNRTLVISIGQDIPAVQMDYEMIISVLTNLISNALRYTPEGDIVRLEANSVLSTDNKQPTDVEIRVIDRGPGLTQKQQAELFTSFSTLVAGSRPEQPSTDRYKKWSTGVGLGLYISRGLVEAHGSSLTVKSVPGEETIFAFALKVANLVGSDEGHPL